MAVTFGFYNSLNSDRRYTAEQMGSIFDGIIVDGIYQSYGNAFQVQATTGRVITVGVGRAWFKHTWLLNDSLLSITADASEAVLHRYDEVVIEIDSTDAVRANSIKIIKGTPASSPVRPTLTHTATVNQYSLATIYRAGASASIIPGDITNRIGSAETPYALSVMTSNISLFSLYDTAGLSAMHRTTFRGMNLGGSLTATQKTAIQSGLFTDLWLGDYWVIGGVTWRIVDFDYWYGCGDTPFNTHHVVVMPDTALYTAKMHGTSSTATGYSGSLMRSANLATAKSVIASAFPSAVLTRRDLLSNGFSAGEVTTASWYSCTVEIPNEFMIQGSRMYAKDRQVVGTNQFALFAVKPAFKLNPGNINIWTSSLSSVNDYAGFAYTGMSDFWGASEILGVRPIFAIGV